MLASCNFRKRSFHSYSCSPSAYLQDDTQNAELLAVAQAHAERQAAADVEGVDG